MFIIQKLKSMYIKLNAKKNNFIMKLEYILNLASLKKFHF
jgi:hypothetical protein